MCHRSLCVALCFLAALLQHAKCLTDEQLRDKLADMERQIIDIKNALRGSTSKPLPSTTSATTVTSAIPPASREPPDPFWNKDDAKGERVFLYTFMDKVNDYGCASIRSAILSKTNVTIFGLSDTLHQANGDRYHGFRDKGNKIKKVFILHKYLELMVGEIRKDDIVIFNDGLDVLYTQTASEVSRAFRSVEKPDTALFAAERTCFPNYCKEPETSSSFKYVNSGDWIARFDVALRLLRAWTEVMKFEGPEAEDQTAVHEMILGQGRNPSKKSSFKMSDVLAALKERHPGFEPAEISLDHSCAVFQTGFKTKLSDGTWQTQEKPGDTKGPYLRPEDGVIFNTETNSAALFVHFNGERFWFKPVEQLVKDKYTKPDPLHAQACRRYVELYPDLKQCAKLMELAATDYCDLS